MCTGSRIEYGAVGVTGFRVLEDFTDEVFDELIVLLGTLVTGTLEEPLLILELVTGLLAELLLMLELGSAPTPTQYDEPSQKLVKQSSETSGFHLIKLACEIPYLVSTAQYPSPLTTVWKALQFLAMLGCVGPVGLLVCALLNLKKIDAATKPRQKDIVTMAKMSEYVVNHPKAQV